MKKTNAALISTVLVLLVFADLVIFSAAERDVPPGLAKGNHLGSMNGTSTLQSLPYLDLLYWYLIVQTS
jgi:hypothetical protein